jgi:hypothetical protein
MDVAMEVGAWLDRMLRLHLEQGSLNQYALSFAPSIKGQCLGSQNFSVIMILPAMIEHHPRSLGIRSTSQYRISGAVIFLWLEKILD